MVGKFFLFFLTVCLKKEFPTLRFVVAILFRALLPEREFHSNFWRKKKEFLDLYLFLPSSSSV